MGSLEFLKLFGDNARKAAVRPYEQYYSRKHTPMACSMFD